MKNLGGFQDKQIKLSTGILDGRSSAGEGRVNDFRMLLNVATHNKGGLKRLNGFVAWGSGDQPSNEDLHDQLLGAQGSYVDGEFVVSEGQREAITMLAEVKASSGVYYSLAATRSRLYASTGRGRNWRILADGLGGTYINGDSPWPNVRLRCAQVGDFVLFTNGIDPVLVWPVGGPVITTGDNADRRWAAFEVYDLLGLGITRAGVIAGWNGFAFIGDVVQEGNRYPGRVFWSDSTRPLEWAPGGESAAGFADLEPGETVLAIEPIGGQLRCFTDKAIYAVRFVGGSIVFLFEEIYRGDLVLAIRDSLVNAGDTHVWMTQDSIVALGAYDRVPNRYQWIHDAAGFIFEGMDGRITQGWPGDFAGFNPIDKAKCHQVAAGHDPILANIWFSWPCQRTSPVTPDDPEDFEGTRRLSLVINPRYQKASLVDRGFSAFAQMRVHNWSTVRDFMVEYGVCSEADVLSSSNLLEQKEGFPLNTLEAAQTSPTCIWNATEDPTQPMSSESLAARVRDLRMDLDCKACVSAPYFAMADAKDFCIKRFDTDSRLRQTYLPQDSTVWVPEDVHEFPNVVQAEYEESGYPTLIQGEVSQHGTASDKIVNRLSVNYDAEAQSTPGRLYCQIGVTNSAKCVQWHNSTPQTLDCLEGDGGRPNEPADFAFYRAGAWVAYRLFVATASGETVEYAPKGCGVTFNETTIRLKPKNETWSNQ